MISTHLHTNINFPYIRFSKMVSVISFSSFIVLYFCFISKGTADEGKISLFETCNEKGLKG